MKRGTAAKTKELLFNVLTQKGWLECNM